MALPSVARPAPDPDRPTGELVTVTTFASVYAAEVDKLHRVAFLLLGSTSSAEEVVQDAFVKLHLTWKTVDNPAGYLRVCVVNASRDRLRRRRRLAERIPRLHRDDVQEDDRAVELADVLLRLPYRQRAAIVGRFYAGWDDAAIAVALGVRPATVRSLVHRGLADLRRQLGDATNPTSEEEP